MTTTNYQNWTKSDLIEEIHRLRKNKKYGLVWEDKPEKVVEQCKTKLPVLKEVKSKAIITDPNKPVNLLIEGDNYHALSVLNYTHKGKIDVIYIDPPYNTGARDWKYNNDYVDKDDSYRHSKWLSMMDKRLRLAKNLLSKTGVLICAIDENELNRLGLLIEYIFNNNELHCITIVHNPRGVIGSNFSYTHEYAYFSFPKGKKIIGNRKIAEEDVDWRGLRDNGGESLRNDAKNCFYSIVVDKHINQVIDFGDICEEGFSPPVNIHKDDFVEIYPVDKNGIERKWRYARQSIEKVKNLLRVKENKGIYDIQIGKDFGTYRTVWIDRKYDANMNMEQKS